MDQGMKKVICCNKMKMQVENYGGAFPLLDPEKQAELNALADRVIAMWEEGFNKIIA